MILVLALLGCAADAPEGSHEDSPEDTARAVPARVPPLPPTAPVDCLMPFPRLPAADDTGQDTAEPLPDVDPVDLLAHWPLDGDWGDPVGGHDLTPVRAGGFSGSDVAAPEGNSAYGPTGLDEENGAIGAEFTGVDVSRGLTLEAWLYKPSNNTNGTLIGWGDGTWAAPELRLADSWGNLLVSAGRGSARVTASFARPEAGCWHHLALVVPPDGVGTMALYLDGVAQTPTSGTLTIGDPGTLFGSAFRLGTWRLPDSVAMRMDEARVWGRALTPDEVALRAVPRGDGERCPSTTRGWEPGPRCELPPARPLRSASTLRVLTDDTVVLLTDPSEALEAHMVEACGEYLSAMEANLGTLEPWWWRMHYGFAALDVRLHAMPPALEAWGADDFLLARTCEDPALPADVLARWTQPVSEWRVARLADGAGEVNTGVARTTLLTWARLPYRLADGTVLAVRDAWGNRVELAYDDDTTVSWALKVAQVGFASDDPHKRAILGHFMGPAGAMDLSRFAGAPFQVVDEADGRVAFEGRVAFVSDDPEWVGEQLWSLDFGALTTPGRYYVRLPGAGRTHAFDIGPDAMGNAFLAHARGLYHNRCAPLDPEVTPWARGDVHAVFRGGFPPDTDDYRDHAADGWGFTDAGGDYVSVSGFAAVAASATETPVAVEGGWHDAGDFDRRPMHLEIVRDLATAYLLAPENFVDGQLDLPRGERANGVPDLLDEAAWGLAAYRSAQQADGGVGTWMEATSHPQIDDPGADHQPYYLSLATRDSSLAYARHAALLARALVRAGAIDDARAWLASAESAWAYGTGATRQDVRLRVGGSTVRWRERPTPDAERRMLAAVQLQLATEALEENAAAYRAELAEPAAEAAFTTLAGNAWWQLRTIDLVDAAVHAEAMPEGWGELAVAKILEQADGWRAGQEAWAYGWAWYPPEHRYVGNVGWGQGLYRPLRELVLAWKVSGDDAYRHAAQLGLAYLLGANPQGRSFTTGLGTHRFVTALHLPSYADAIAEVSPGITVYGAGTGLAQQAQTAVWGVDVDPRGDPEFQGADVALLPPPWDNAALSSADVRPVVEEVLPRWRRLVPLEGPLPQNMEFTVWETIGPAVMVTGVLLEPGWTAEPDQLADVPLDAAAWRDNLWMMP